MEYSQEQLDALNRAGLTEDDLQRDVESMIATLEELNSLYSDADASNIRDKLERHIELYDDINDFSERYLDPASRRLLDAAYENLTGEELDDYEFDQLEDDMDAFNERYNADSDFEAAVDAAVDGYSGEFEDRVNQAVARSEDLEARREALEANYENELTK